MAASTKVKSLLVDPDGIKNIKKKYDEIYGPTSDVWLYKKSHGVHTVVMSLIHEELKGKSFLDAGCGAGRLPIMASYFAKESHGFDFSEPAIAIAQATAECAGKTVNFFVNSIEGFSAASSRTYDVLSLLGTLEHVPDPVTALKELQKLTAPGGTLIVSCPNFINPRGYSYMPLLTLFNLPMSLADVRQVDFRQMRQWAKEAGYELTRSVGAIYRFGWDKKSAEDMIRRIPLAMRDAEMDASISHDAYNRWQQTVVETGHDVLEWLYKQGALKKIVRIADIQPERRAPIDDALWTKIQHYLNEDIESDPYYGDTEPFCYMGGECIYVLKKPV